MAKRLDEMYAEFKRSNVPVESKAELEEARSEDRFAMWLVGISAAVIALTLSTVRQLSTVSLEVVLWATMAFTMSIICGVMFRMMFLGVEKELGTIDSHYRLYTQLEAVYENPPSLLPKIPYNAKQIATEIKDQMGRDYMALLEDNCDVAFWRKLHEETRVEWLKDGVAGLKKMREKEFAFAGETKKVPNIPELERLSRVLCDRLIFYSGILPSNTTEK